MPRNTDTVGSGRFDAGRNAFDLTALPEPNLDWSKDWVGEGEDLAHLKKVLGGYTGIREAISSYLTTASAVAETARIDWNAAWDSPASEPWLKLYSNLAGNEGPNSLPSMLEDPAGNAGGPEEFARKTRGGTGSTSTSGAGTTSGSAATTTSAAGTTTTTATTGTLTTLWQSLNPPMGDTGTPTDTHYYKQWNLSSSSAGINVLKAWQNYTAKGVEIGVIDDGIDYTSTDLAQGYLFNLDYDATTGGADAFGTSGDKHGTTVAGVIGAARDGTGIVGVAYNAGIAGFRISYGADGGPAQINDAFAHARASGMDVVNASWGYTTPFADNFKSSGFSGSKAEFINDVMYGRGGLGMNIVFAAGNARGAGDNVNYHNYQNSPFVITVAGVDSAGKVASFSNPGAAILVSAPGSAYTDDRVGSAGYVSGDYISVSGTSYAAPAVSGVVALMLEANPNLGYRDVQQILAYSAKLTDPTSAGWKTNAAQDWNGGGLHFNHDYGFGLVDATAAVRLAESWQTQATYANLSTIKAVHTDNAAIPDGTGSVASHIVLNSSMTIDKVLVDLNITHAQASDLVVTLVSPGGTTAVLVANPAGGTGTGIVFETSANNFWGEDSKGDWTLTVTDKVSGNTGTLNGWTLTTLGDANAPHVYIYTDEFAAAAGAGRAVLLDATGAVSINTAAVTTGSYLDLRPGATDMIAGRALTIDLATIVKSVWAGDGNDIIIANDFGNTIQGGRGNDTITAGKGVDILYGGPGSDTIVYTAVSSSADTLMDFQVSDDVIDLRGLFESLGYTGADAVADGWIKLEADASGTGTNILLDAHDGHGFITLIDVIGVSPALLKPGVDYLVHV